MWEGSWIGLCRDTPDRLELSVLATSAIGNTRKRGQRVRGRERNRCGDQLPGASGGG